LPFLLDQTKNGFPDNLVLRASIRILLGTRPSEPA